MKSTGFFKKIKAAAVGKIYVKDDKIGRLRPTKIAEPIKLTERKIFAFERKDDAIIQTYIVLDDRNMLHNATSL